MMKLFSRKYGDGFPLVILHGLLGSLDNWHSIAQEFSRTFGIFSLDQRNHGRSPHSREFNYDVMAEDLRRFLEEQGLKETHLLGHSMGGKTAMTFALTHPALVRKLVVVDIAPRSYPAHHDYILEALADLDLDRFDSRKAIDEALADRIENPAVRQFLMKNLRRDDAHAFAWKMNLPVIRQHYDNLNSPVRSDQLFEGETLFVRGTRSDYVLDSDFPEIRRLFPRARFADVDSGHWVHAEAPKQFSKIVLDFLRERG